MPVSTNRFLSALATVVSATATYVIAAFLVDNQAAAAVVAAIASAITGLLVPAAAAPVGTVDALDKR